MPLSNKKTGKDPNEKKISKPEITPIVMNRDAASNFLKEVQGSKVQPIEPVFIDYNKDMDQFAWNKDVPVLYKQNTTNDLFYLRYIFEMGNNNDKKLGTAAQYLRFLGTSDMTLEQLNSKFYGLACSFNVSPGDDRTYITLSGLNENLPQAIELFEKILADAQPDKTAYDNMVKNILKSRTDAKLNQMQNFIRLLTYAVYGKESATRNLLSTEELQNMNPSELTDRIHKLTSFKHRIMYYGPSSEQELTDVLNKYHKVPAQLQDIPAGKKFCDATHSFQ